MSTLVIILLRRENNQVRIITLWFINKISLTFEAIHSVYVYDVFSVCQWLYLFYNVHTCNNVLHSPTQPRANSDLSVKGHLK